ncbi:MULTISPECIES: DUF4174 domain-containing protein [Rhizobium]|jgi:hypothetical protein|uniref:DUF4174 domain-containing protein n=1 Tax=Rhizobium anhuiense TaxID=1184720 RepID=A0A3S0SS85_9HYPH|nr:MULTISPECIES: DUF4174 domain-containing protein [Rhizobium]KZS54119.1 hypothetical protein AS890_18405 [Rhizobium anhuiense bv. trifolii]NKM59300.1 DUF4174 domain-containing protein [Rhizobium anhuiense]PDS60407.1 DUF4174 domain-containing protein [Rhizobium anhuiense]PDS67014.1 DUF4174 domain-containing protein [Rhizobium anhuiense]RUM03090.1 DUF4174 domain-containing protein [Rhizobium anhuiense]
MLKSIVHEIIGASRHEPELPQSLEQFRDRKRVLIIFADAQDDRPIIQDEWLRKAQMRLIEEDVEVFTIAGGGAFALFDDDWELDADDIRARLQGPPAGEFGLILIGRDGTVRLRSSEPQTAEEIFAAFETLPKETPW